MKKFSTVEEYLELIAGYRDLITGQRDPSVYFFTPIINLARYDTGVVDSMTQATLNGTALTERQGALAVKLIVNYKRQLAAKLIDVSPIEANPVFRVACRKMDYSRVLELKDDTIIVRFPYNTQLIETFRTFSKTSHGVCKFDQKTKEWTLALTEHNLNWIHAFATSNGFSISSDLQALAEKIFQAEKTPYRIELGCVNGQLEISNCPDSLRKYIEDNIGGFDPANLEKLVDASGELGYTVEPTLLKIVAEQVNEIFAKIAQHKEVKVRAASLEKFKKILDYAIAVKRTPVVIYEPDKSNKFLDFVMASYNDKHVQVITDRPKTKDSVIDVTADFVHTHHPLGNEPYIPMLVSTAGMVFGSDRQLMLQASGKIIYLSEIVYKNTAVNSSTAPTSITDLEI